MKKILLLMALISFSMNAQVFFEEDFDGSGPGLDGWVTIDNDGFLPHENAFSSAVGTAGWAEIPLTDVTAVFTLEVDTGTEISGNVMGAHSWYNPIGQSDDWAITPMITIPAGTTGVNLKWIAFSIAGNTGYLEDYKVLISTTGNSMEDFDTILLDVVDEPNPTIDSGSVPVEHIVNLDTYAGQDIYIAFNDYSNDQWGVVVDNIKVEAEAVSITDLQSLGFDYAPNPVNDVLNLSAKENLSQISIINLLGQEVISSTPNSLQTSVDFSELNAGVYMVNVVIGETAGAFKIVKK